MSNWKTELLNCYVQRNALATGEFMLAAGGKSDFYIDGRLVTTHPAGLRAIVKGFNDVVNASGLKLADNTLVAPAVSGISIAAAIALDANIPFVIDRGIAKQHGKQRRFEGAFFSSPDCVVVDDLVTVASTLLKTVTALRELGKQVKDVIVVVDREEGGQEILSAHGVRLHSLLTKGELKKAYETEKRGYDL